MNRGSLLARRAVRRLKSDPAIRDPILRVLRTLIPLSRVLSRLYRTTLLRRTRVVAVVGSYGKTTTTRALSLLLLGSIHRYLQNNAGIWVPLTILRTPPGARHQVVEVGISGPGQMREPARDVAPDLVVVTCIGSEHNRSFAGLDDTRDEKVKMVEALEPEGIAVLNGDDERVRWMASRTEARVVTFGESEDNHVRLLDCAMDWPHGSRVTVGYDLDGRRGELELHTRLIGRRTMSALLAATAVGLLEGLDPERIRERLESLEPNRARLQIVELPSGAHLVRDELKSGEETVDNALDVLEEIPAPARKILILGEVAEPTTTQGKLYRRLGRRICETADLAFFIGTRSAFQKLRTGHRRAAESATGRSPEVHHLPDGVPQAIDRLRPLLRAGDVALIKGRDTQRLQRISLALTGVPVACSVRVCQLRATNCHYCSRLTTGWEDGRETVP